jgi:hypothetical protein
MFTSPRVRIIQVRKNGNRCHYPSVFSWNHRQSRIEAVFKSLVVEWVGWVSQVKDDGRVRSTSSTVGEWSGEVNGPVEVKGSIRVDVNVLDLVVRGSVDQTNLLLLKEVISDDNVLLIRSNLDVMRADDWLLGVRVIKALRGAQVRDVESEHVVVSGKSTIDELAILSKISVDGNNILSVWSKIVQNFSDTLVAVGVFPEWVNDPKLTESDSASNGSRVWVTWDELDILDTLACGIY